MAYSILCQVTSASCGVFDIRLSDIPAAVQVYGLTATDCAGLVTLRRKASKCSPYTCLLEADCLIDFTSTRNIRPITVPGRYKIVLGPCSPTCDVSAGLSKGSDYEGL